MIITIIKTNVIIKNDNCNDNINRNSNNNNYNDTVENIIIIVKSILKKKRNIYCFIHHLF